MFPRSGGEKVYLEAVYQRPKLLITVFFAVQAVALGFTGTYIYACWWDLHVNEFFRSVWMRGIRVLHRLCG
jgi:hypothetical protein